MANWSNNTSVILSYKKNNENLKKVYDTIDEIIADTRNGKCDNWETFELYSRLTDLTEDEILNGGLGYIRGHFTDAHFDEYQQVITLEWETAWEPMIEGLEYLLKSYGLYSYTIAEEPGQKVYVNTDVTGLYFPDRFLFDAYDEESGISTKEYFETEAKAVEFVRDYLGRSRGVNSFKEAEAVIEKYNKKQKGYSYIAFEEFTLD